MNISDLNALFHDERNRSVFCSIDTELQCVGYGLVQCEQLDRLYYFGVNFEHGIATGNGFLCVDSDPHTVVELCYRAGDIIGVIENKKTEKEIVDEDTGRRWEGNVNEREMPCGYGVFYDADGLLEYEGLCLLGKRCGFGITYYPNGFVSSRSFYIWDKKFGHSVDYDLCGNIIRNGVYCNDLLCTVFQDNQLLSEEDEDPCCQSTTLVRTLQITNPSLLHSFLFRLDRVTIGPGFHSSSHLVIERLNSLSHITFLDGSCSQYNSKDPPYLHVPDIVKNRKSLRIQSCPNLQVIRFGRYACSDYTSLQIKLPSLRECAFGEDDSYCFYAASELEMETPLLSSLIFGEWSFYWTERVNIQSRTCQ